MKNFYFLFFFFSSDFKKLFSSPISKYFSNKKKMLAIKGVDREFSWLAKNNDLVNVSKKEIL